MDFGRPTTPNTVMYDDGSDLDNALAKKCAKYITIKYPLMISLFILHFSSTNNY